MLWEIVKQNEAGRKWAKVRSPDSTRIDRRLVN
jgi:hypothetical protein